MENNNLFYNIGFDSETKIYESGTIKTYPAHYAYNQHVLTGTATSVKMRGSVVVEENGIITFAPTVSSNLPRYQTIYKCNHGFIRETKEDFIFTVKLPKRWGKKRVIEQLLLTNRALRVFLNTLKW